MGEKIIVFLMTCASVDFFSKVLSQLRAVKELGLKVEGLHGRMVQKRRTAVSVPRRTNKFSIFWHGAKCPTLHAPKLDTSDQRVRLLGG